MYHYKPVGERKAQFFNTAHRISVLPVHSPYHVSAQLWVPLVRHQNHTSPPRGPRPWWLVFREVATREQRFLLLYYFVQLIWAGCCTGRMSARCGTHQSALKPRDARQRHAVLREK